MLVEAMRTVLKVLMETLTYEFANAIRRQRRGGAIGMELTGFVAQIFMVWWDKKNYGTWTCILSFMKIYRRHEFGRDSNGNWSTI